MVTQSAPLSVDDIACRIADKDVAAAIASLLHLYYYEIHDLSSFASAENCGRRIEGLANEIYACFHHIARGVCEPENTKDQQVQEICKAKETHLKRLALDAYKIIIASFLEEYAHIIETVKYFVLVEYAEVFQKDIIDSARGILESAAHLKQLFLRAKKIEKTGNFSEALAAFENTLESCYDLRQKIFEFNKCDIYHLAVAKYAHDIKTKDSEHRRDILWKIIFVAINAAVSIAVSVATYFLLNWLKS